MPGFLLVNPRSGDESPGVDELADEARGRGIDVHVLEPDEDAAELARGAPAGPLGMAGGDGSLGMVASVAIERDLPFVSIPFGTRNHFARDLGLDRDDPLGSLAAFAGEERRIDVGTVNGDVFLNNVSLGVYAQLVHHREHHRRRRNELARLRAIGLLLRRPGPVGLVVDGQPVSTRVLLVSNNQYQLDVFSIGERERLDEGLLYLSIAHGWLPRTWEERSGESFTVEASAGKLRAAVDGEPVELETPVRFEIRPRALAVLVPG